VYAFLMMLLILDAALLILVVLLQSGKGSGLAAEFGGASSSAEALLGGRQAVTVLTKATWTLGGVFLALSVVLSVLSARGRAPASILEGQIQPPVQEAPTPLLDREQPGEPQQPGTGQPSGSETSQPQQTPPGGGN
jgi:preprotein translocase subunit SecG